MKKTIGVVFNWLILAGLSHAANPQMPNIPPGVYKVTDFGAVGDGATDNTISIQNTINKASAMGGGIVEFPAAAGSYLSGPIVLASRINLQVDANATLQMLPLGTYPGGVTNAQTFIYCNKVHDLEISGWGTIDGQGAPWWTYYETNESLVRPMMLNLYSVNRLFIHDITFQNPPYHHCGLRQNGGNITISNLTVNTPYFLPSGIGSHNTDGLNFVGTNSIIENCHITCGDDNIAMGSTGLLNDLLITNCVFGAGHGVSIGGTIDVGVSNLTVINCSFNGTTNGIRWKCSMSSNAPVQNISYYNLTMTDVGVPIVIYSYYPNSPNYVAPTAVLDASNKAPVTATTPVWRNITISNLTAVSSSKIGGIIWGPTEMPITNVTLICITNNAPKTFNLYNVHGVNIIDSQFNIAKGYTFTLCNADATLINTGIPDNGGVNVWGSVLTNAGDLTLTSSMAVNFALGTAPATIVVKGNLALEGAIDITAADGFGPGTYTLFTYTGVLSGKPVLGIIPTGYICTPDTSTAGQVNLVVTPAPISNILNAVDHGAYVNVFAGQACGPLIWIDANGVIHIGDPVGPGPSLPFANDPVKPLADLSPAARDAVIAALLSGVANAVEDKHVSKQLRALSVKIAREGLRTLPNEGKQR